MAGIFVASLDVELAYVGMQNRTARDIADQHVTHCRRVAALDMEQAGVTATLDQTDDDTLLRVRRLATDRALGDAILGANIGFVGLHDFAFTAQGAGRSLVHHRLADAVREEPGGLIRDAEHTMELVSGHA